MTARTSTLTAMSAGLILTIVATVVPFLRTPTGELIARHVRAGYPSYDDRQVGAAVMIYLVGLAVVGVLGTACWVVSIVATHAGKRWVPWVATVAFVVGTGIALFDLSIRDTSGDTGLPPLVGWIGVLPSVAGFVAVLLLWLRRSSATRTRGA
jgi:hypothetical protein